ncbi:hypothetical protein WMF38_35060 [Sorangium sp. So ce118]
MSRICDRAATRGDYNLGRIRGYQDKDGNLVAFVLFPNHTASTYNPTQHDSIARQLIAGYTAHETPGPWRSDLISSSTDWLGLLVDAGALPSLSHRTVSGILASRGRSVKTAVLRRAREDAPAETLAAFAAAALDATSATTVS